MVRNLEHAQAVQKRRHDAGRRGYAKAVRRLMRRSDENHKSLTAALPVRW